MGVMAALTAALGVLAFIVLRKKGHNEEEESNKEAKEVQIEENNKDCKQEITEQKTVTEHTIETHESIDTVCEVDTKDTREISEDTVKVHTDTSDSPVVSEVSDMSSRTESLMEWIDRQLREAEMKTSGQWPSIDSENGTIDQIVTDTSTNEETKVYKVSTLETDVLTEELEGDTENVQEVESAEINMQTEVQAQNVTEVTEAVASEKSRDNAENELEEISFKDGINEDDRTTLNISDKNPEVQANTSQKKGKTHPDKTDADVAELHSDPATERVEEMMTWDVNGYISDDTEIELLMEEPSQTYSEARKLLEDSETESDASSTEIITAAAGHYKDNMEEEMKAGVNCANIHTEKETIILRPAWQKKVS